MKIGITGATGFIGKNLIDYLIEKQNELVILKRENSKISYFKNKYPESKYKIEYRNINYFDINNLEKNLSDVDCLIYLSGITKSLDYKLFYKINLEAVKNVVKAVNKVNENVHFIFISSQAATGPAKDWKHPKKINDKETPISHYGKSKLLGEKYVKENIKNWTVLRLTSVFGPYDFDGLNFFKMAIGKFIFNAGKELPKINLIYVKEFVRIIDIILNNSKFFRKSFHIGYPEAITTEYFVESIRKVCGLNKKFYYVKLPILVVQVFAFFLDIFQRITGKISILNKEKIMEIKALYWIVDCEEFYKFANTEVKYTFEQMVKDTLKFYTDNGYIKHNKCKNI